MRGPVYAVRRLVYPPKLTLGRYHTRPTLPNAHITDLIARAFREPLADLPAWRALSARVRPQIRRRTDAECDRRLGALAGPADRAEALDLVWRRLIADRGQALTRCAADDDFDGALDDTVLDLLGDVLAVLDRRLVQRWRAGDTRAGNHLARRLRAVVYARVHRVLGRCGWGGTDVDDAAQDAWLQVTRALDGWHPNGGTSLENWVGVATERAVRTRLRDAGRQKRGRDRIHRSLDEAVAVASRGLGPEEATRMSYAVEAIDAAARDALSDRSLRMAYALLEGRPVAEVAEAFGVTPNQVYKARSALKKVGTRVARAE